MNNSYIRVLLLAISLLLVSCGGGGGGGSQTGASTEPATVGLVITDAVTDEWDEARATITQVSLISDAGHEILFTGEKTIDLLSLREHVKLFVVKPNVKPGYYSKIRLQIKELVLVKNNDGTAPTLQPVKVPSNKVDLNPQGTFYIAPGSVVFASLDWDMEKSLKFTETCNSNTAAVKPTTTCLKHLIMRPVIFVDIGSKPAFKKGLVRLYGTVQSVATGFSSFRLCSDASPVPLPSAKNDEDFCVDVLVDDRTGIFDDEGAPRTIDTLAPADELTVFGWLRLTTGENGDPSPIPLPEGDVEPTKLQIKSIVVESGPEGTWEQIRGSLTTFVDPTNNTFGFDPDTGAATLLTAQLYPKSRVFRIDTEGDITEVLPPHAELKQDDRAQVDAVLVGSDGLNVALMLWRSVRDAETESIGGTISAVSLNRLTLHTLDGSGTQDVCTDFDTKVFLFSDAGLVEISVIELQETWPAVATGITPPGNGCLQADVIVAQASSM